MGRDSTAAADEDAPKLQKSGNEFLVSTIDMIQFLVKLTRTATTDMFEWCILANREMCVSIPCHLARSGWPGTVDRVEKHVNR